MPPTPRNDLVAVFLTGVHAFLKSFPYVARPWDPTSHHHRVEPSNSVGDASAQPLAADEGAMEIIVESEETFEAVEAADGPLEVRSAMPAKNLLLRYTLSRDAAVTLRIFDVQGRSVKSLIDERSKPGAVDVAWNGTDDYGSFVGKGRFFARYSVDGKLVNTKKLVIR